MINPIRITISSLLLTMIFISSCKKSSPAKSTVVTGSQTGVTGSQTAVTGFHMDYSMPPVNSGYLQTLMFMALSDNSTLLNLKIHGYVSGANETFQLMLMDKTTGLKSITNYSLNPAYRLASTSCAVIDKNENIWLGGSLQLNDTSSSKPFVIELDKTGNVIMSKYFPIYDNNLEQDNYGGFSLKVLNNGDLLYIVSMHYDVELIRMNTSGKVSWIKQYVNPTGSVFQHPNSNIIETSAGEFIFLVNSTGLFKTDANGNIIYQFSVPEVGLSARLIQLLNGDLIITGENESGGPQQSPYIFKIDPSNGNVLSSKIMTGITNNTINDLFDDIQEINGQLRFTHSSDTQYNTVTMDENLNVLSIQRTLSHLGGFGFFTGIRLYFDVANNAIYHNIDIHGPTSTYGFQFLKTDLKGKSCHADTGAAVAIPLDDINKPLSNLYYTVNTPIYTPVAVPFVVTKSAVANIQAKDGCGE